MSAALYYYARGKTGFSTISLSRISDLAITEGRAVADVAPLSGVMKRADRGGFRDVSIISERITDAATIRQLRTLESHLRSGGRIAFALDTDKAYALYSTQALTATATGFAVSSSSGAFPFNTSAALVAGDEITIEDYNPDQRREVNRFDSISGRTVTVQDALSYSYADGAILRHEGFFPVLFQPEDVSRSGSILTSDHRRNWTLDLSLRELPGELAACRVYAGQLAGEPGSGRETPGGLLTLDDAVRIFYGDPSAPNKAGPVLVGSGLGVNQWNRYGMG